MLNKNIEFIAENEYIAELVPAPTPAIKNIPDWYEKTKYYMFESDCPIAPENIVNMPDQSNLTMKACMPFFDAMTSGYIYKLPCDIFFVDPEEYNGKRVVWTSAFSAVAAHGVMQVGKMPILENYDNVLKWIFPYNIRTPRGYSCMFSHPKYNIDLPFLTLDGVVDTDTHPVPINFPFLLKKGFVGKVSAGTPVCQIVPFKRENWTHKVIKNKNLQIEKDKFSMIIEKGYKKKSWKRKEYK